VSGSWRGIACSTLPSAVPQVTLAFATASPVPETREPPI